MTMCQATLTAIIQDIADRCGVDPSELDLAQLEGVVVNGFVLGDVYTGASAIEALRVPFFFDPCEADGVVRFVERGGASVATITESDLVDDPDRASREQGIEYPRKLHLSYQNADYAYVALKATATRISSDVRVVGESAVEVPVVLNEVEAAQISDKLLKVAWSDAEGEVRFSLPDSFLRLVPTDIITLNLRGTSRRLRIVKIERSEGVMEFTCRVDRQSAYTVSATNPSLSSPPAIPQPTPPPPSLAGETTLVVLDIPALTDTQDALGLYVAARGESAAWYGCEVQLSIDGGTNYGTFCQVTQGARIGTLLADITAATEGATDTTNVILADFGALNPEIESVTTQQFLNERNAAAIIRPDGTAEIIQFRDADPQSTPGHYALSYLARGRLATGTTSHLTGSTIVLLEDVQFQPLGSAFLGQNLTFRGVSYGVSPVGASEQTFEYVGRSQIEFAPLNLEITRSSSDGVTATWVRRDRFGTDIAPIQSINWQGYRVTFTGDTTTSLDTTATTANVPDTFGSEVTVTVAQINRITGAGPTITGTA